MFRIGEFSKLTQVSIRMLRYYDETGLLKPANIDKFTGYRMYSVEQFPILQRIVFLRDTGFNISEIAVALSNWDNEYISLQLEKKQQEIQSQIEQAQGKLDKIAIAVNDIFNEKIAIHCNFTLKNIPSYQVISLRRTISNYYQEGLLWQDLFAFVKAHQVNISTNSIDFAIYHDTDYKDSDVDVEVCIMVDQMGQSNESFTFRETEEVETMACAMVSGPFKNIGPAYETFAHWLMEHNQYQMTGKNRQICHRGPWNELSPDKYLTEIQIPVKKRVDFNI